jgi:hypothetical protein
MTASSEQDQRDAEIIAMTRRIDVHKLDAALPSQSLEAWLTRLVGGAPFVLWEVNDCGEQTGNPANTPADFPICAEAAIALPDGRSAALSLVVGTHKKGVFGAPKVWSMCVTEKDKSLQCPRDLSRFSLLLESK